MSKASQKTWREANKAHRRRYMKMWEKKNKVHRIRYRKATKQQAAYSSLKSRLKRIGLTVSQYEFMIRMHGNKCAICLAPPRKRRLAVDHDHETGRIRGLLCRQCNQRLIPNRDADLFDRAVAYLRSVFDGRKIVA